MYYRRRITRRWAIVVATGTIDLPRTLLWLSLANRALSFGWRRRMFTLMLRRVP